MNNNLQKLEKDLRAFAKRCKDIKYTRALLFVFLLTGLLSMAAPADNVETARRDLNTSITDMKKLFREAKQENNKLMKGSNLELIQLMEQGDQVVKSPWSSWQYGMNYFYNSWTGTYKGRGDKTPNQKYERFSSSKFAAYSGGKYGTTDLNSKVIEPISSVPIDAAVKPKIATIKTVDSVDEPKLVTPTLNISVSTVAPSSTTVPSITPPSITIPGITMSNVSGFTLIFPNSGDIAPGKHLINGSYEVSINNSTRYLSAQSDRPAPAAIEYAMFHEFGGNYSPISKDETITMEGVAEADNTYIDGSGNKRFYGGGSRFAYVDDVRNSASGVTFTLKNNATINLVGPAIAAIVNEETSYTDGNVTTNITNVGRINDESEQLTYNDEYEGTLRATISTAEGGSRKFKVNSWKKIGYKVGIAQTTEETISHTSGTNYELFNGSTDSNNFSVDFEKKFNTANSGTNPFSSGTTKIDGSTMMINGQNVVSSGGVIHFSGDYSTGIQVASAKIPVVSSSWPAGTPTTWSDNGSRSLVRANNKADGYMQLDGAYSYGMKLAGAALYVQDNDWETKKIKIL